MTGLPVAGWTVGTSAAPRRENDRPVENQTVGQTVARGVLPVAMRWAGGG
jgi:hypothetical protein